MAILERIQGSQYVIKLLGVCEGARYRALVLEYAPNGDLDSFLSRCTDSEDAGVELQHCKDWNFRLCLISQIALGLQFLHKQDILHRDLKSRNVFLDKEYNCKASLTALCDTRAFVHQSKTDRCDWQTLWK